MQKLLESFQNCSSPFDTDERKALFCLSSGKPAPPEVMEDLLECEQRGISAFNNFVQQRLMEKSVSFHSPMKKTVIEDFLIHSCKDKGTVDKEQNCPNCSSEEYLWPVTSTGTRTRYQPGKSSYLLNEPCTMGTCQSRWTSCQDGQSQAHAYA